MTTSKGKRGRPKAQDKETEEVVAEETVEETVEVEESNAETPVESAEQTEAEAPVEDAPAANEDSSETSDAPAEEAADATVEETADAPAAEAETPVEEAPAEETAEETDAPVEDSVDADADESDEQTEVVDAADAVAVELSPGPVAFMAYRLGAGGVRLSWGDDHGNHRWRVYRTPSFVATEYKELGHTSYVDRGLTRGQTYTYFVVALSADEVESAPSVKLDYTVG